MKEYEYMIIAIDEVICHDVAGIICVENYFDCYFPNGFRKVFDLFSDFREEYKDNKEKYQYEESLMETVKFQRRCRELREMILAKFIDELKKINLEIDYGNKVKEYLLQMDKEDIQTTDMYLRIYPLLMLLIREKEEQV